MIINQGHARTMEFDQRKLDLIITEHLLFFCLIQFYLFVRAWDLTEDVLHSNVKKLLDSFAVSSLIIPFGTCIDTPRSYCDDCKRCKAIRFSCLCSAYVKLCNSIEPRDILLIPSDEHHCDLSAYEETNNSCNNISMNNRCLRRIRWKYRNKKKKQWTYVKHHLLNMIM